MVNRHWEKDFPTKVGYYWFYGWVDGDKYSDPELLFVECVETSNSLAYVSESQFLYRNVSTGMWCIADVPELPF